MMIEVLELGKRYVLGESVRSDLLRDRIATGFAGLFNGKFRDSKRDREDFWALKNVSFDVSRGEVLGIIGSNGAGKSTLLKVLSRITEPTVGEVRLRGRVASLLEVGTGFHKELTGRENIFLNGAILGMNREEIKRKFDDIVEFAGVERFVDTPVKRYSSGMTVRLAFAVAAHLEPEIMVVDEVLAVGDQQFQARCLGKMDEVARSGRTILFVSHNMAAVENLCSRCILLNKGELDLDGDVNDVIAEYCRQFETPSLIDVTAHPNRVPGMKAVIRRFQVLGRERQPTTQLGLGEPASFEIEIHPDEGQDDVVVALHFYNQTGQRVTTAHTSYQSKLRMKGGRASCLTFNVDHLDLMPGHYNIVAAAATGMKLIDRIEPVAGIDMLPRDVFKTGTLPPARDGIFILRGEWMRVE